MMLFTWFSLLRTRALSLLMLMVLFGVSACAVQTGPNGQLKIGLDDAEIFGRKIATFKTVDGGEGSLRVLNGRYSMKLHSYAKIIPIDNVMTARILRTDHIDGRTVVILEKGERYCNYKYTVMSILGNEVLSWDVGDCNTQAQLSADEHNVYLDFASRYSTARYAYRDMRLLRGEIPAGAIAAATPAAPNLTKPNNARTVNSANTNNAVTGPRYQPPLPILALAGSEVLETKSETKPETKQETKLETKLENKQDPKIAKENSAPKKTTSSSANHSTPSSLPTKMDFPMTEQKPVRIILDK
jgi:hypothetical protein